MESQNHDNIIEWSGLEETLKTVSFQSPAMGKDTFQ